MLSPQSGAGGMGGQGEGPKVKAMEGHRRIGQSEFSSDLSPDPRAFPRAADPPRRWLAGGRDVEPSCCVSGGDAGRDLQRYWLPGPVFGRAQRSRHEGEPSILEC